VTPPHVSHHSTRVVIEVAAVGALELWRVVHHLVAVDQFGVVAGVRTVRTVVDAGVSVRRPLAAVQLHLLRPESESLTAELENRISQHKHRQGQRDTSPYFLKKRGRPILS